MTAELFICKICNSRVGYKGACSHLKIHGLTVQQYYDQYENPVKICSCGADVKFISLREGYAKLCTKCARRQAKEKSEQTQLQKYGVKHFSNPEKTAKTKLKKYGNAGYSNTEKRKRTCLQKYGTEFPSQNEEIKLKIKSTNIDKYGGIGFSSNMLAEKVQATCVEKYGVDNFSKTNTFKDNLKLHNLEKYGVEHYFQTVECKEKTKQNNLEKYGVEHYFQSKECEEKLRAKLDGKRGAASIAVQDAMKQTCLSKYGVEHPMQLHEISSRCHHKYSFDGKMFDSAWELIYYIWLKDHNISFVFQPKASFTYTFNSKEHTYNPDFLVEGNYIELKGLQFFNNKNINEKMINPFDRSLDDLYEAKHQCMLANGVKIISDISEYEKYVNTTYTPDFIHLFKTDVEFPYPNNEIIKRFHHSIYTAHVGNKPSPVEAWQNKDLVYKTALNRLKYVKRCKPSDIVQGFNVSKIAPKVSVFKRSVAKHIVETYLSEFHTVFDPFSGFSGRMLGVTDCEKRYIGQDINETHVKESNEIIKTFGLNATVICKDIFESEGEYESMFTCSPYHLKEIWNENETDMSCDEWIDECLKRFKCKRYVFVVDETEKYKDKIVETITNESHFGKNNEYVIVIEQMN